MEESEGECTYWYWSWKVFERSVGPHVLFIDVNKDSPESSTLKESNTVGRVTLRTKQTPPPGRTCSLHIRLKASMWVLKNSKSKGPISWWNNSKSSLLSHSFLICNCSSQWWERKTREREKIACSCYCSCANPREAVGAKFWTFNHYLTRGLIEIVLKRLKHCASIYWSVYPMVPAL